MNKCKCKYRLVENKMFNFEKAAGIGNGLWSIIKAWVKWLWCNHCRLSQIESSHELTDQTGMTASQFPWNLKDFRYKTHRFLTFVGIKSSASVGHQEAAECAMTVWKDFEIYANPAKGQSCWHCSSSAIMATKRPQSEGIWSTSKHFTTVISDAV